MISLELDRERAARETNRSFAVEASAGTGKTRILIDRILHLVLEKGPDGPPVRLSTIAAITFTEKAAGEMKVRLRQEFEQRATRPEAGRARQALRDLETAAISTIHAFAVALLKERPVEAGLDPRFTALDELQSELLFRTVWESWLGQRLQERHPLLECALRAGLNMVGLGETARTLRLHSRIAREWRPRPAMTDEEITERIRPLIEEGERYLAQARDAEDRLALKLEAAMEWLRSWPQEHSVPEKSGKAGSKDKWAGGKVTVDLVRKFIARVVDLCEELSTTAGRRLFRDVVLWLVSEFLPEWERRKREEAALDFDDQLVAARDLLKRHRAVRRYFHERFVTLLVDEFQDTDPVQLEIVQLLSDTRVDREDPDGLQAAPGRLFIVGDPKQSIYRFRGADIETYMDAVSKTGLEGQPLERLELTTNFRSVPSILKFVDSLFGQVMSRPEDGLYQPSYLPFHGSGWRQEEISPPSVHVLANEPDGSGRAGSAKDLVRGEAACIGRLISAIYASEHWKVHDKSTGLWRPPDYSDIAILLPALTRADAFEDSLRDAGIPHVLEGGKFYYARSEVSSAITALRAIENPNDTVALYGTLRSIFFGLSDEDLLRARIAGEPLDYRLQAAPESRLHRPYQVLHELHSRRHHRPPSETFEILLAETGAREILASRRGGFQSLANLGKLTRTVRAQQSGRTFSEVADFLTATDEEEFDENESRIVEERSNAVRMMTIHKAKGLDFPIVVVAGLGLKKLTTPPRFLAGSAQDKVYGVAAGRKELGFRTPDWEELLFRERQREEAELIRLLYVAMTRARDHLVLSTRVKWKKKGNEPDLKGTRLEPVYPIVSQFLATSSPLVRRIDVKALKPAAVPLREPARESAEDWSGILKREYEELRRLTHETPASRNLRAPSDEAEDSRENRYVLAARERAVRIGIAFHEAMEVADFGEEGRIPEWAAETARRHSLDDDGTLQLEEMMRHCFRSDLLSRARLALAAGTRVFRELAYVRPLAGGGSIEEGKIDLLFQEDGEWVIVDYKTDRIPEGIPDIEEYFCERYSGQIREYVNAVRALGLKVKAAYLLVARNGRHIRVTIDDPKNPESRIQNPE